MRLFCGLPLPPDAAAAVERWTAPWRSRFPRLAWVPATRMHISLHFFGEVAEAQARQLAEDLERVRAPAIQARAGEAGRLPPGRGPVRVLFLGLATGAAEVSALQALYASRIASLGHALESRPFVPHLTLARVRGPVPGVEEVSGGLSLDFIFDRVILYESVLRPGGPDDLPLRTAVLGAAA